MLVGESKFKIPLEIPRCRWKDNIKTYIKDKGDDDVDWMDSSGTEQGPAVGSCEYGNELSGSVQERKFLEQLRDCQILKKQSATCS